MEFEHASFRRNKAASSIRIAGNEEWPVANLPGTGDRLFALSVAPMRRCSRVGRLLINYLFRTEVFQKTSMLSSAHESRTAEIPSFETHRSSTKPLRQSGV